MTFENKGALTATIVIAASNSMNRRAANIICDGVGDQVEINEAILTLAKSPEGGGKIVLLDGFYSLSAPISLSIAAYEPFHVWIDGMGLDSTRLRLANNSNCNMIENIVSGANDAPWKSVSNMTIDGNGGNQASGHGIYQAKTGAGSPKDSRFLNIYVHHCKQDGWHIESGWGVYIDNCLGEYNDGHGFYFSGTECYLYGLHSNSNVGNGFHLLGGGDSLTGFYCVNNGGYGIYSSWGDSTISSGYIKTWGANLAAGVRYAVLQENAETSYSGIHIYGADAANSKYGICFNQARCALTGSTIQGILDYSVVFPSSGQDCIVIGNVLERGTATGRAILENSANMSNKLWEGHSELFMDILAASTNHVGSWAGTGVQQVITVGITQPDVPRNLTVTCTNNAAPSGIVAIVGINSKGFIVTEDFTIVPGGTATGNQAFARITSITIPATVTAADTVSVGIESRLGLANDIAADVYMQGIAVSQVYKVKKNNAHYAAASYTVDYTYDTVDVSVGGAIVVGDDFTIWYMSNLNKIF